MLAKIVSNLLLYTLSFLMIGFIRKGALIPDGGFTASYSVYITAWLVSSAMSRKFRDEKNVKAYNIVYAYFISFFLMLGLISVFLIKLNLNVPHFILFSALIISFAVELTYLITKNRDKINHAQFKFLLNGKALIVEFIIYSALILYIAKSRLDFSGLNDNYTLLILSLFLCWFVAVVFGHHSNYPYRSRNYWNIIWPYIRSYIIIICLNTSVSFILWFSNYDILVIIRATIAYTFLSYSVITLFYQLKKTVAVEDVPGLKKERLDKFINALPVGISFDGSLQYEYPQPEAFSVSLNKQLKEVYLKKFPEVYNFLWESINLCSFEISTSVVQRSNDIYNLETLPDDRLELFFNLREVNDFRRINYYLIEINKKLKYGGIFVSKIETINLRYKRFLNNYPYYLARLFYFIDFIWRRVFPKLPGFKRIYFALTKGNNRAVSFAEGLGRLYYCGFEVINAKVIDNYIYFIAKKVRRPYNDPNPSYGPLFKMRRTGLKGVPIYVYKLRTMHPYAEYLQKFVYEKFSLQEGGKFNNDFRVTSWGKIFRKLWIDELPMIINFFKGDLKLVGVRPLSNQYLNLYSEELRCRRMNYKPGLIPPFYVDMPKTLKEIMASEERYLEAYDKHPVLTDLKYLFQSAYNIIIKSKRSN